MSEGYDAGSCPVYSATGWNGLVHDVRGSDVPGCLVLLQGILVCSLIVCERYVDYSLKKWKPESEYLFTIEKIDVMCINFGKFY